MRPASMRSVMVFSLDLASSRAYFALRRRLWRIWSDARLFLLDMPSQAVNLEKYDDLGTQPRSKIALGSSVHPCKP